MTGHMLIVLFVLAFGIFGLGIAAGQLLERRALERMFRARRSDRKSGFPDYPAR